MNWNERCFACIVGPEFCRHKWTLYPQVKIYNPHVSAGIHMVADFIAVFEPPRRGPLAPSEMAAIELDGMSYNNPGYDKARANYAFAAYGLETWRAPAAPMLDSRGAPYGALFFDWAGRRRPRLGCERRCRAPQPCRGRRREARHAAWIVRRLIEPKATAGRAAAAA